MTGCPCRGYSFACDGQLLMGKVGKVQFEWQETDFHSPRGGKALSEGLNGITVHLNEFPEL